MDRFALNPWSTHFSLYSLQVGLNEECVPREPVRHGSVSGLPTEATGNKETTGGILAEDAAEKGGATNTLNTPCISEASATKHRARVLALTWLPRPRRRQTSGAMTWQVPWSKMNLLLQLTTSYKSSEDKITTYHG